ncbi:hypothetical protein [Noviherbaspirillum pedocola]|uniref:Uncharacterized protein n=1 Tax=Noviherbaspirillum pedocola TaxID=2801341 RepID=A0A934SYU4_9BURK|nr:hypothetical protein [Noviherbaspirillum pedocola]MBK4737810.1 hypothetical protein [Noviherbaspirillum pedocola]
MEHDFLPDFDTPTFIHPAAMDGKEPPRIPIQSMLYALDAALRSNDLNIFAPPNDDYWHLFMWQFDMYAANIYVDDSTKEAKVDLFPFLEGAISTAHPLVRDFSVAKALYVFPAGNA